MFPAVEQEAEVCVVREMDTDLDIVPLRHEVVRIGTGMRTATVHVRPVELMAEGGRGTGVRVRGEGRTMKRICRSRAATLSAVSS